MTLDIPAVGLGTTNRADARPAAWPVPYGTQPPDSRFLRYYDADGSAVFVMSPYPLPLVSVGLLAGTLRRECSQWPRNLLVVAMTVMWFAEPIRRASFGSDGLLGLLGLLAAQAVLFVALGYVDNWCYWRRGLVVRVAPGELLVHAVRPWGGTRDRTWPCGTVTGVVAGETTIRILGAGGRCMAEVRGSHPADVTWLASTLRVELGVG